MYGFDNQDLGLALAITTVLSGICFDNDWPYTGWSFAALAACSAAALLLRYLNPRS